VLRGTDLPNKKRNEKKKKKKEKNLCEKKIGDNGFFSLLENSREKQGVA